MRLINVVLITTMAATAWSTPQVPAFETLKLRGIVGTASGRIALLEDPQGRSVRALEGSVFADGSMRGIRAEEVFFFRFQGDPGWFGMSRESTAELGSTVQAERLNLPGGGRPGRCEAQCLDAPHVSAVFSDAKINHAIGLIAEVAGLEFTPPPPGKEAIRVRASLAEVPWPQALKLVAGEAGFGLALEGRSLRLVQRGSLMAQVMDADHEARLLLRARTASLKDTSMFTADRLEAAAFLEMDRASALLQRAAAIRKRTAGTAHPETLRTMVRAAEAAQGTPAFPASVSTLRAAIAQSQEAKFTLRALEFLVGIERDRTRLLDEASRLVNVSTESYSEWNTYACSAVGDALKRTDSRVEGRAILASVASAAERRYGPRDLQLAGVLAGLADCLSIWGDHREAGSYATRVIAILETSQEPASAARLASIARLCGVVPCAEVAARRALAAGEREWGPDDPRLVEVSRLVSIRGPVEPSEAVRLWERVVSIERRTASPQLQFDLVELGQAMIRVRDFRGARAALEEAIKVGSSSGMNWANAIRSMAELERAAGGDSAAARFCGRVISGELGVSPDPSIQLFLFASSTESVCKCWLG